MQILLRQSMENGMIVSIFGIFRQRMEYRRGRNPDKYNQVENLIGRNDFITNTSNGEVLDKSE